MRRSSRTCTSEERLRRTLGIYTRYPSIFRYATLGECEPLTRGGLVPIVDDGNGYNVCLFDPLRRKFVVKFIEEPEQVVREFDSWQQYLAYALLEIAGSGPSEAELVEVAQATGFEHTRELLTLLREMEGLPDGEIDQRSERFIQECGD